MLYFTGPFPRAFVSVALAAGLRVEGPLFLRKIWNRTMRTLTLMLAIILNNTGRLLLNRLQISIILLYIAIILII